MKKLFSIILAGLFVVSMTGLALSHSISYEANGKMSNMTVPVYNNAGATLDAGDVVIWDIDASTSDERAYVTTTTTADTAIVAGVIWPSDIASSGTGSMVVWGLAQCDIGATGIGVSGPLCSSATAGGGDECADNAVSYVVSAVNGSLGSQVNCFVKTN